MIGRANAAFQEIINLMQQIKTFAPSNNQGNPSLRGNLTQQLGNKYAELVEATIPILWFSNYRSSGIKDAQLKTATLLKDIEEQKTKISSVVGESRELLARQKKLSADITITAYGILFKNEAEQHEASAKKWLITTGAIAALTTIAAVYNYVASLDLIKGFSKVPASQAPNLPHCCPNSLLIVSVD